MGTKSLVSIYGSKISTYGYNAEKYETMTKAIDATLIEINYYNDYKGTSLDFSQ